MSNVKTLSPGEPTTPWNCFFLCSSRDWGILEKSLFLQTSWPVKSAQKRADHMPVIPKIAPSSIMLRFSAKLTHAAPGRLPGRWRAECFLNSPKVLGQPQRACSAKVWLPYPTESVKVWYYKKVGKCIEVSGLIERLYHVQGLFDLPCFLGISLKAEVASAPLYVLSQCQSCHLSSCPYPKPDHLLSDHCCSTTLDIQSLQIAQCPHLPRNGPRASGAPSPPRKVLNTVNPASFLKTLLLYCMALAALDIHKLLNVSSYLAESFRSKLSNRWGRSLNLLMNTQC